MTNERSRKLGSMRQIIRLLPVWVEPFEYVRFDRDGEVVLGYDINFNGDSRTVGHVSGRSVRGREQRVDAYPEFAPHQTVEADIETLSEDHVLIGYAFSRIEYAIYKAVLEAEDEKDESIPVGENDMVGGFSHTQSTEAWDDQEDDPRLE